MFYAIIDLKQRIRTILYCANELNFDETLSVEGYAKRSLAKRLFSLPGEGGILNKVM